MTTLGWLRIDDKGVGYPAVIFTLSGRDFQRLRMERQSFLNISGVEYLERDFETLIKENFPEYSGGVLLMVGFDYARNAIYGTYVHSKLPKIDPINVLPKWLLLYRCSVCRGPIEETGRMHCETRKISDEDYTTVFICEKCHDIKPDVVR